MWQFTWLGSYDFQFKQGAKNVVTLDRKFAGWLYFFSRHYLIKIKKSKVLPRTGHEGPKGE